jgi:DNA-binding transcriptional LysR family regulator
MDLFDGMDVFAHVVELGSFTAAADRLEVSKSRISARVRELETRLGVRLLDRTTRRLTPTEAGRIFYRRCREARETAHAAEAEVQALQTEPLGLLRVASPELFTRLLLVPALPAFFASNPRIRVEFVEAVAVQDLVKAGLDLAIRIEPKPQPNLIARRIGSSQVQIFASPAYLAAHEAPKHPRDVAHHATVGFSPLFWAREWRFSREGERAVIPVEHVLLTNSTESVRAAAFAGIGLVQLPGWAAADAVRAGTLVRVLEDWDTPATGIFAVYPSNRLVPPKVKRFVDAMAKACREAIRL